MLDTYVYAMAAQVKYGCSWLNWRGLADEIETPPGVNPVPRRKSVAEMLASSIAQ
jgi:hypothetical protein